MIQPSDDDMYLFKKNSQYKIEIWELYQISKEIPKILKLFTYWNFNSSFTFIADRFKLLRRQNMQVNQCVIHTISIRPDLE